MSGSPQPAGSDGTPPPAPMFWDRRTVSDNTVLAILATMAHAHEPLNIADLARRTGIHRASLHRNLETLVREGWVLRDESPIRYRLSLRFAQLGIWTLRYNQLRDAVLPHVMSLALRLNAPVGLAFYEAGSLVFVDNVHAVDGMAIPTPWGGRVPAHTAGPGKVFLAHMREAELRAYLDGPLERFTPRTKTDPAELLADLALCRRRGYGYSFGEYANQELGSVGYPVFNHAGEVVACITQGIRDPSEPADDVVAICTSVASRASIQLGFREGIHET